MRAPSKSLNKKKKKKKKGKKGGAAAAAAADRGFVAASAPGCYIAHAGHAPSWAALGAEPFEREAYGLGAEDAVPDLAIDPEDGVLTVINAGGGRKSFYLSTECACFDAAGRRLAAAPFRDARGREGSCTTFVLSLPPRWSLQVCRVAGADIFSHVSELPPDGPEGGAAAAAGPAVGFPLGGPGPFLCSQGRGGQLSHFGVQRYGVDLECAAGTPVLACGPGVVAEVRDRETCRGPHAENLFHWNSLLLRLEEPPGLVVEYVHIRAGSARVEPGQRVARGQLLCESGDAGFAPVPHLHFQCHQSSDAAAPTVPFVFEADDGSFFVPACGAFYSSRGKEPAPPPPPLSRPPRLAAARSLLPRRLVPHVAQRLVGIVRVHPAVKVKPERPHGQPHEPYRKPRLAWQRRVPAKHFNRHHGSDSPSFSRQKQADFFSVVY